MKFVKAVVFTGLVMGLAACGAKNSPQAASNIKANIKGSPTLEGKYASKCDHEPKLKSLGVFLSSKMTYQMYKENATFDRVSSYYSDENCTKESLIVTESGTVNVVSSPQNDQEPTQEDFTFTTTLLKPIGPIEVEALNKISACNVKDNSFAVGIDKNVSTASGRPDCVGEPAGRVAKELVLVKSTDPKELLLGAAMEKSERPDKLDEETPYLRED